MKILNFDFIAEHHKGTNRYEYFCDFNVTDNDVVLKKGRINFNAHELLIGLAFFIRLLKVRKKSSELKNIIRTYLINNEDEFPKVNVNGVNYAQGYVEQVFMYNYGKLSNTQARE